MRVNLAKGLGLARPDHFMPLELGGQSFQEASRCIGWIGVAAA